MPKRKRVLSGLVVLGGVATAIALWWPTSEGPQASLKTIARLAPGMTEAEVAAKIGPPSADVTAGPPTGVPTAPAGGRLLQYDGDRATATVAFGPDGRMVRVHTVVRTISLEERIRLRTNWWW
jgi:hypothetical protein